MPFVWRTTHLMGLRDTSGRRTPRTRARVARRIRAGNVNLNGTMNDRRAPFGGYKQSGNGREWGRYGIEEYSR